MLTGQQAFSGNTTAVIHDAILNRAPVAAPLADPELQRILGKALEKDRRLRYQSASDLRADLERLKRDTGSATMPTVAAATPSRRWLLAATLGVIVLVAAGLGIYLLVPRGQTIESLAVLPFANTGGDPNTEYLTDGITESLINNFSQLPNLTVMSRSAVFRYKGKEADPQTAGRELKVQAVLTGRLVQRGDNLSVSAELVDVRTNRQIWGDRYDRKTQDLLAIQQDISREISEKLRQKLKIGRASCRERV